MKLNGMLAGIALAGAVIMTFPGYAIAADAAPAKQSPSDAYSKGGSDFSMSDPKAAGRGGEIYATVCAACHDKGLNRAPQRAMLSLMTPESIHRALTVGVMKEQAEGAGLTDADKKAVAEYLTNRKMGAASTIKPPRMCAASVKPFDVNQPPVFTGWGLNAESNHFIPTRTAGIDKANAGKLKLKWALAFPNAIRARSQPALAGHTIFVGSHDGTVFALDQDTGCARWVYHAGSEVRTGMVVAPWTAGDAKADPLLYFGDLIGNVYALKARTGAEVWKFKADEHPNVTITAAPALHKGVLYVSVSSLEVAAVADPHHPCCTFRGSLVALDAAKGTEKWRAYTIDRKPAPTGKNSAGLELTGPSGAPIWNTASIDDKRGQLYVGTGENYSSPATGTSDSIIAIDMKTGKKKWVYQATPHDAWNTACERADTTNCPKEKGPDFDFGAGTMLVHASNGKDYVVGGQKSGALHAVDPDTGKLVWKQKVGRGGVVAGIHFGIAATGDTVFAPVSDVPDGKTYPEEARPGLYALDVKTGNYVWKAPSPDICKGKEFCHPGYSGAITSTDDLVMAGANDGYLRLYDAKTGKVAWEFNTVTDFKTVNGTVARGGSMGGGAAPLAYDGMLVMNSGYGFAGKMPGNVLLVFGVN
jgi:polyvinyl alcohol dehydrogenase (cytochrome)